MSLTADFYIKTTKDWLVEAPILATAGTGAPFINGGDVKNTGFELALTWNDQAGKDFNYNIGVNGAYNKNKVGNIPTEDGIIHGKINMLYDNTPEFYRHKTVMLSVTFGDTKLPVSSRTKNRLPTGMPTESMASCRPTHKRVTLSM